MRTLRLVGAELLRAAGNRTCWAVALGGVAMVTISVFLAPTQTIDPLGSGLTEAQRTTQLLVINTFAITLFTSIIGVFLVTRDIASQVMNRTLRLAPNLASLMIAKAVVAAIFCFVVGVIAAVAVLFATEWVLRDSPMGMDLGSSIAVHVAKHALNAMLSGVWGVFLGFLLRIPLVAVLVQVVYAFLLEPAVAGAFPDARRFLIGGAGSAVVDDPTLPLRLDFFQGVAVYAAWIVLLAIIAYMANRSRKGKYSMSRRSALASEEVGL